MCLGVLLTVTSCGSPSVGGRRVALIIGNGAYRGDIPHLPNPEHDARSIAVETQKLGYQSLLVLDANRDEMGRAVQAFAAAAKSADMVLVFYSGHGFEVNGRNVLLPVDFTLSGVVDVESRTYPLAELDAALAGIKGTSLVFIDACRDDPFKAAIDAPNSVVVQSRGVRTPLPHNKGLADQSGDYVTALMYATGPGQAALDGNGENSPFATAILQNLPTAGRELRRFLSDIQLSVSTQTHGAQVPSWNTHFVLPATPLYNTQGGQNEPVAALVRMVTEAHPASGGSIRSNDASVFPGIALTATEAVALPDAVCDASLPSHPGNLLEVHVDMRMANGPAPCVTQFFSRGYEQEVRDLTVTRPPAHGTVSIIRNAVGYVPAPGFTGTDSFECEFGARMHGAIKNKHVTVDVTVR